MATMSYTCPACARTSHNPNDVKAKYCGFCHTFEADHATLFEEMLMATGVSKRQAAALLLLAEDEGERIARARQSDSHERPLPDRGI